MIQQRIIQRRHGRRCERGEYGLNAPLQMRSASGASKWKERMATHSKGRAGRHWRGGGDMGTKEMNAERMIKRSAGASDQYYTYTVSVCSTYRKLVCGVWRSAEDWGLRRLALLYCNRVYSLWYLCTSILRLMRISRRASGERADESHEGERESASARDKEEMRRLR